MMMMIRRKEKKRNMQILSNNNEFSRRSYNIHRYMNYTFIEVNLNNKLDLYTGILNLYLLRNETKDDE